MRRRNLRATPNVSGSGRLSGGDVLSLVALPISSWVRGHCVVLVWVLGLVWALSQPTVAVSSCAVGSSGAVGVQTRGSVREPVSPPSQLSGGRSGTQLPQRRSANLPAATIGRSAPASRPSSGPVPSRGPQRTAARGATAPDTGARGNASSARSSADSTAFPYNVYTVSGGTAVRSTPSDDAYPTAVLPPQTELQVWRHDPNGWLAVRPPPGSFSLIEAKHLQTTTDPNVYAVTTDRAKAWVGTEVDDDHTPIWQVRLQRNERVAVISSLIIQEEGGEQTWYQIEPPAGEFRWVHQDDLRPGSVAYRAPSRRSPDVNRPQAPADAPMSGFMPPVGAGRTAGTDGAGRAGGAAAIDLPPLELDSAAAGQGWGQGSTQGANANGSTAQADPRAGQWRPAQQTTPVLGYADPMIEANPSESGWNASLVAHSGMGGADGLGGLVQAQTTPAASSGGAPGDAWDAAVNRLRQDPVAAALAEQGPTAGASTQPAGSVAGSGANSSSLHPATAASALTSSALVGGPMVAGRAGDGSAGEAGQWNQQLAQVQARLSQELSLPPTSWNLVPLLEQCRSLWSTAPTLPQREAAETVGRQIEELIQRQWTRPASNDLTAQAGGGGGVNASGDPWAGQRFASANGFVGSGSPGAGSGATGSGFNANANSTGATAGNPNPFTLAPGVVPPTASGSPVASNLGRGAAPGATSFDAVGYLKELLVARGQTREFVLQDDTGRSICHLAAQPGVNLQSFLDQKVGVIGIKGIHGRLNLPHVNVERIYRLP